MTTYKTIFLNNEIWIAEQNGIQAIGNTENEAIENLSDLINIDSKE